MVFVPVHLYAVAQECRDGFRVVLGADNLHLVPQSKQRVVACLHNHVVAFKTRADESAPQENSHFVQVLAIQSLVGGYNGHVVRFCVGIVLQLLLHDVLFFLKGDAQDIPYGYGGSNHADDAEGISAGVGGSNLVSAHSLF